MSNLIVVVQSKMSFSSPFVIIADVHYTDRLEG